MMWSYVEVYFAANTQSRLRPTQRRSCSHRSPRSAPGRRAPETSSRSRRRTASSAVCPRRAPAVAVGAGREAGGERAPRGTLCLRRRTATRRAGARARAKGQAVKEKRPGRPARRRRRSGRRALLLHPQVSGQRRRSRPRLAVRGRTRGRVRRKRTRSTRTATSRWRAPPPSRKTSCARSTTRICRPSGKGRRTRRNYICYTTCCCMYLCPCRHPPGLLCRVASPHYYLSGTRIDPVF